MIPLWMKFQIIQFYLNETFIEMLIFHYNWFESINWLDFNYSIQWNDFVFFFQIPNIKADSVLFSPIMTNVQNRLFFKMD